MNTSSRPPSDTGAPQVSSPANELPVPLPTCEADAFCGEEALVEGVLMSDGLTCVSVSGNNIVWPSGFSARFSDGSVELLDARGEVGPAKAIEFGRRAGTAWFARSIDRVASGSAAPPPTESTPTPTFTTQAISGAERDWRDDQGRPAPDQAIIRYAGPEHCDWQRATFMEIYWATLGLDIPSRMGAYVDDLGFILIDDVQPVPTAAPGVDATGESVIIDAVPPEAIDTGFSEDGVRLWVAPDGDLIWLQYEGRVEQWPVLLAGCM